MQNILLAISFTCCAIGTFTYVSVLVGVTKFENIYNRIHIVNVVDMLGLPLSFLGVGIYFIAHGMYYNAIKILIAIVMWYLIIPLTSYIIIKISYFYNKKL